MAIPRITSREYNIAFMESASSLDNISDRITSIKNEIEKKLKIINYENNLTRNLVFEKNQKLQDNSQSTCGTQVLIDCRYGEFERYGFSVFPKLSSRPTNIFNLQALNSKEIAFRQDVEATLTEVETGKVKYCTDILKHGSIDDKELSFFEFDTNRVILSIKKTTTMLGYFSGNMIEINPFLAGTFDIDNITFYKESQQVYKHTEIKEVKREAIVLDQRIDFDQIDIDIRINHRDGKFPFGLKGLYILDANFIENSYCVSKINNNDNILKVLDRCSYVAYGQKMFGRCSDLGVKIFTDKSFSTEISVDTNISRNVKEFYIAIPLVRRGVPFSMQSFTTHFGVRNAGTLFEDPTDNSPPVVGEEDSNNEWTISKEKIVPSTYKFVYTSDIKIDDSGLNNRNIYIKDENNRLIDIIVSSIHNGMTLSVSVEEPLLEGIKYSLYIEELKDLASNILFSKSIIPLRVNNSLTSLELDIKNNYEFYLKFDSEIDIDSTEDIFITDTSNDSIDIEVRLEEDNKKLLINPSKGYFNNNKYSIYVNKLLDIDGNVLKENYKVVLNTTKEESWY